MNNTALLAIGSTLLCGGLAVAGIHVYASGKAQREALVDRLSYTGPPPTGLRTRRFTGVDRRLRRTALGKRIQLRLSATGLDLTPGEFTVYVLGGVAALWLIASAVLAPFFGPVAGLVALWAGNTFLNWQRQKRIEAFINQLPELSRILANATAAGLALRTALGMAAEELDAPAGEELATVTSQLALGRSIDEALGELAERLPSRELVVLVTTLVLSNRAGGTVVGSLRNLTETLEERKETRREVITMLSEVNATAYTLPLLGLGAMIMLNSMDPGSLARMTGHPLGQAAVIVALALYAVGFVGMRRLGKIEV
ncbi:type II secretion system F family protein [Streptomyces sp. NBC_01387]|uniref:type II secretion system F family protein n=1 Tax=unclassified Streptomyces TaxID=2593676 RepID=UPI0020247B3A|nr:MULTISPECIES: type II secretion system F family protein [unclassified Streptomyces]MCX4548568.1 type II secretion system F family protein [Streptomyces sp. NBC_01500]WSC20179.1 type II secretion system F family protein [Streptomyces sp. NBC_01766]WSV54196.1 type II secretion system F family protein [Streptomyces sp. NBC_01014]